VLPRTFRAISSETPEETVVNVPASAQKTQFVPVPLALADDLLRGKIPTSTKATCTQVQPLKAAA